MSNFAIFNANYVIFLKYKIEPSIIITKNSGAETEK